MASEVCLKARFVPSAVTQRAVPKGKRLPKRSPGLILNLISLPGGILAIHSSRTASRASRMGRGAQWLCTSGLPGLPNYLLRRDASGRDSITAFPFAGEGLSSYLLCHEHAVLLGPGGRGSRAGGGAGPGGGARPARLRAADEP